MMIMNVEQFSSLVCTPEEQDVTEAISCFVFFFFYHNLIHCFVCLLYSLIDPEVLVSPTAALSPHAAHV